MKYLHKKTILPYELKNIFDLVMDIESYPEFLPWISSATIITKQPSVTMADLIVNFSGFKQSYRSNITYAFQENGDAYIEAESHTGPFKHLKSKWCFAPCPFDSSPSEQTILQPSSVSPISSSTAIDFTLEFELKSKLMTNIVSSVIINAQEQMIEAFANRAREKYDKKS